MQKRRVLQPPVSHIDAVSLFLSVLLFRATPFGYELFADAAGLQQAIKDRRFPTYLAPIKDVTDEVLRDILPVPSDIQHIAEILIQVSNA